MPPPALNQSDKTQPKQHTSQPSDNMILWSTDYLLRQKQRQSRKGNTGAATIVASLPSLAATEAMGQRLRSQHEFHNPAFFQTIIDRFGIQDTLGTELQQQQTMQEPTVVGGKGQSDAVDNQNVSQKEEEFMTFEYNLLKAEEQVMIRQQQQQLQQQEGGVGVQSGTLGGTMEPTAFAQQQLQQAMRR